MLSFETRLRETGRAHLPCFNGTPDQFIAGQGTDMSAAAKSFLHTLTPEEFVNYFLLPNIDRFSEETSARVQRVTAEWVAEDQRIIQSNKITKAVQLVFALGWAGRVDDALLMAQTAFHSDVLATKEPLLEPILTSDDVPHQDKHRFASLIARSTDTPSNLSLLTLWHAKPVYIYPGTDEKDMEIIDAAADAMMRPSNARLMETLIAQMPVEAMQQYGTLFGLQSRESVHLLPAIIKKATEVIQQQVSVDAAETAALWLTTALNTHIYIDPGLLQGYLDAFSQHVQPESIHSLYQCLIDRFADIFDDHHAVSANDTDLHALFHYRVALLQLIRNHPIFSNECAQFDGKIEALQQNANLRPNPIRFTAPTAS